jgi:hypothetical protein
VAEDELVPVMVQRKYLTQVYGFLAQLDGQSGQAGVKAFVNTDSGPAVDAPSPEDRGWSEDDLRDIASSVMLSVERLGRVMDVLSSEANKRVPTSELALATGLTLGELQGALSGFTRWVNSQKKGKQLPYRVQQAGPSPTDGKSWSYYWVNQLIAARWNAIRGGSNP